MTRIADCGWLRSVAGMRRRARRGVTLVELTLTMVIAGVLASAVVGAVKGSQTWRRAGGVRRVQADLTYARDLALLTRCRTLWNYASGAQTYELRQETIPLSGAIGGTVLTQPTTGAAWSVPLSSLGGLSISTISGTPDSAVGFGAEGTPLRISGAAVSSNVVITFNGGAVLTIDRGSGLSGVTWP